MMWDEPPDYHTVPGFRTTTFHAEIMAGRMPISRDLLDDPRTSRFRHEIMARGREQAMMVVEREVWKARLPTGTQTIPVEVEVPYSVAVPMTWPRTWWQRMLGRPRRVEVVEVGGTVTARATVRVDLEAEFRYPDANERLGPAIPTGQASARPGRALVEVVSTYPGFGPHAAVSTARLRCPDDGTGCGHHVLSHIRPDVFEHGGCTIDGCDCRRYFEDHGAPVVRASWAADPEPVPGHCTARLDHNHGVTRCGEVGPHDEHRGLCAACLEDDPADAWLTWRGAGLTRMDEVD